MKIVPGDLVTFKNSYIPASKSCIVICMHAGAMVEVLLDGQVQIFEKRQLIVREKGDEDR